SDLSLIELTAFGFGNTRAGRPVQQPANSVPGLNQRVQVYSSVDTQAIEHVENVFGGDIAGGALGVGAPAKPGNRAVEYLDAFQQSRVNIRQRLPVGIVKMAGPCSTGNVLSDGVKPVARGAGRSGANGVAQGESVAAHGVQFAGYVGHLAGGDLAVIGAAQHAGYIAAYPHAGFGCRADDRFETPYAFADRAVDIALGKPLRGRGKHRHFVSAGL